jgi:hypothetical protein
VLEVPVLFGGFQQRLGDGQAGVVDHQVQAAEREHGFLDCSGDLRFVGHVDLDADGDVGTAQFLGHLLRVLKVQVGNHYARAVGRQTGGDRLADTRRRTGHQRDAGGVGLGLGHPGELGFFEAQYSMRNFSDSSIGA